MKKPLVSIIIVVYNNADYLENCLLSIFKISYKEKEVIVIDNASTDKSSVIIAKFSKQLRLIKSKVNLGYAAANNLGMQKAQGEYLLVLNPDTEVSTDFLEPLVAVLKEKSTVAACQPAIYLLNDRSKLNLSGKETHYLGFDWIKDYQSTTVPKAGELISFSGCCVLLRKKVAENVGFFDPLYFMYYEDSDLSWKLRLLGYQLWFEPKSKIYHEYKLFPPESYLQAKRKMSLQERNRILTVLKNYSLKSLLILSPMFILIEVAMVIFATGTGWGAEKLKTYLEIFKNTHHIKEHRKQLQKMRKLSDAELTKKFASQLGFIFAQSSMVKYLLNPVLRVYWQVVFPLL